MVDRVFHGEGPENKADEISRYGNEQQFPRQDAGLFPIVTAAPLLFLRIAEEIPAAAEEEEVGDQDQAADTHAVGQCDAQGNEHQSFDGCFRQFGHQQHNLVDGEGVAQGEGDILRIVEGVSDQARGEEHQQQAEDAGAVAAAADQEEADDQDQAGAAEGVEHVTHLKGVLAVEPAVEAVCEVVERLSVILKVGRFTVGFFHPVHAGGVAVGIIVINVSGMFVVDEFIAGDAGIETHQRHGDKDGRRQHPEDDLQKARLFLLVELQRPFFCLFVFLNRFVVGFLCVLSCSHGDGLIGSYCCLFSFLIMSRMALW